MEPHGQPFDPSTGLRIVVSDHRESTHDFAQGPPSVEGVLSLVEGRPWRASRRVERFSRLSRKRRAEGEVVDPHLHHFITGDNIAQCSEGTRRKPKSSSIRERLTGLIT